MTDAVGVKNSAVTFQSSTDAVASKCYHAITTNLFFLLFNAFDFLFQILLDETLCFAIFFGIAFFNAEIYLKIFSFVEFLSYL